MSKLKMFEQKDITLVDDLDETKKDKEYKIIIDTDQESLYELIIDLSNSLPTRIRCVELFFSKFGQESLVDTVNRLAMMYQFSGTKLLETYLYEICTNCNISPFLKLMAAKSLCSFNPKKIYGYKALDTVCQNLEGIATPCQIDAVCLLMMHSSYKTKSRNYFCNIINDLKLNCDYRYKTILSLENKDIPKRAFFLHEAALEFLNNINNMTLYRILAGQYLIQKCELTKKEGEHIELIVMSFAQDPDLDYNLRADAADVVLRLGSPNNKETAREIIMMLGRRDGTIKTIFDNAQNVHVTEIEQSVLEALEFLASIHGIDQS